MARVGRRISERRMEDFVLLGEAAKDLTVRPETVKRWLKENKVSGVVWGRNRRGWIIVEKTSVQLLVAYDKEVRIENS